MPLRISSLSLFIGNIKHLLSKKQPHDRISIQGWGYILCLDFLPTHSEMNIAILQIRIKLNRKQKLNVYSFKVKIVLGEFLDANSGR